MPYIKQKDRIYFNNLLSELYKISISNKGELEFLIFTLMKHYMTDKEYRYSILHDCTYASQHCADEFRRRYLDDRENQAREENGDI